MASAARLFSGSAATIGNMVPLTLFIVMSLVTFILGCVVVGTVIVEARRDGRPMLPEDPRPEPSATPTITSPPPGPAPVVARILAVAARVRNRRHEPAEAQV